MEDKSNFSQRVKYICVLLLMYTCSMVGLVCYGAGGIIDIMIVLLALAYTYVGYIVTQKVFDLLFLYANLLLSVYAGSYFATKLYYERISSDDMTLIIGRIFMYISLSVTILFACVFVVIRLIRTNTKTGKTNDSSLP